MFNVLIIGWGQKKGNGLFSCCWKVLELEVNLDIRKEDQSTQIDPPITPTVILGYNE
jgi:hypothetical protein